MIIQLLKKIFPERVKFLIRPIYLFFDIKVSREVIDDLGEYFNLPKKDIKRFLKNGHKLSADLWKCFNPKAEKEINNFYKLNPFYVFDLLYWQGTSTQKEFRKNILNLAKGNVLDYGGGAGDMSLMLSKSGFLVDYADLPSKTSDFAKWWFGKHNCKIRVIDLENEEIFQKYDTILCLDVIEHIIKPDELLNKFANYLNKDGVLIITNLKAETSKDAPMHFKINFDAEEYLKSLGFEKRKPFLWIKR
jgi:2-polyprenyl-3-methyl-5-hydroxy-6-metoxy-1,4-benzoquinol methylase